MAAGLLYLIDPLGQIQKANDAKRKSDLEQLQRTLETYYNDNGKYPPSSGNAVIPPCSGTYRINPPTGCMEWGISWTAYNTKLPIDPTSSARNYVYYATTDGQSYRLYASLQKSGDPQLCFPSTGAVCTNASGFGVNGCGGVCNFGVSSPNTSP